jgi:hypothetical protein
MVREHHGITAYSTVRNAGLSYTSARGLAPRTRNRFARISGRVSGGAAIEIDSGGMSVKNRSSGGTGKIHLRFELAVSSIDI